ncbi:GTPase IMAP family member 4-like [Labrus bergylta]|uniref:GTPase IMAP family member 4-like n=1 Tax=Labrus bergylta TaxID=56723 RepID=UPI00331353CD
MRGYVQRTPPQDPGIVDRAWKSYCAKSYGELDGQKVSVIDTPGLFDTNTDEETTRRNIIQCMAYASPGPHIFLIVIKLDRLTVQIFGEEANKYSMVLFTHGDQLRGKPIKEFLKKSEDLQELVAKCNNQYHVYDNTLSDSSQTRELLNKIRNITEKNTGNHYTSEMFQEAERAIEEEKQRILKEKEEQMCKEREELMRKIEQKYEQKLKEAKKDTKKAKELKEALKKELEEETKALNEEQLKTARRAAEGSAIVLSVIAVGLAAVKVVGVVVTAAAVAVKAVVTVGPVGAVVTVGPMGAVGVLGAVVILE